MRLLPAPLLALALAGCASPLPPHDPNMAWVDMTAQPSDIFMSDRLDRKRTPDGRYFLVPPGAHELEARYEFEVTGGAFGLFGETHTMRCTLVIRYDDFQAGRRYLFQARSLGFTPQGWLRDEQRNVLVEAKAEHCH
ncbi:hypothetical protein CXK94_02995 [Stutzerimonas stutzeri]|uniref:Lipoprotein n=1 Tax=Stutzerimonas stutzeri TaxID=316 RepID=A0A2N8T9X7_STUST|nr:hypothetical protein [Stutzerimonas stutzeri]MCQ4326031.1 hypothetical protein [Stutzerimonas stutzeri]PNG11564.1 hypothetical protein CXK94_02995 [Stutzerimonas stutzeri]